MGIKSGPQFTFSVSHMRDLSDIQRICIQLRQMSKVNNNQHAPIRTDVDCNWIANLPRIKNTKEVVDFLEVLSKNGLVVTPICDGTIRHHSKRATIKRNGKREKNRLEALICR